VIIQRKGDEVWILTNHHVVDLTFARSHGLQTTLVPAMKKINVTYFNQQTSEGTVTWVAPDKVDLAIVKTKAPIEIEPVSWQGLPRVIVGQNVFAVGNPLGLSWTYTKGVVSRIGKDPYPPPPEIKARELGIIQHDTSITYGNSGGGLYAEDGQLIGINSSIVNPMLGKGLGFAIRMSSLMDLNPPGITLVSPPLAKGAKKQ
jgi:S1-C subfamily serine protease